MPTASEETPERGASAAELDDALARAVIWRRLALGFGEPGPALRRALADASEGRALARALERLGLPRCGAQATEGLERRFTELFGHTVRGGVCPYETEYGAGHVFQQTQELADLEGFYAAFGLARRPEAAERADHLGVECEFAGFLCRKEALTLEAGDAEQVALARRAYRSFLRDHLARFGFAVAHRIEQADSGGTYGLLAATCRALLRAECRRLDIEPGPRVLRVRAEIEDNAPAACGAGADCSAEGYEGSSPLGRAAAGRLLSIGGDRS
jgi:TorA maturation chaperone TorD